MCAFNIDEIDTPRQSHKTILVFNNSQVVLKSLMVCYLILD